MNSIAVWRTILAAFMVAAGIMHFVALERFTMIVPDYLPWPHLLVQISGIAEIALGLGLLWSSTRTHAGLGLIALYIAVFPANIHMAINNIQPLKVALPEWSLWARLPLQLVFIYWAWTVSRPTNR